MGKEKKIILVIIFVAILAFAWGYFSLLYPKQSTIPASFSLFDKKTETVKLPLSPLNPAVRFTNISYVISGFIAKVLDAPGGVELTLNVTGSTKESMASLPKLLVTTKTLVYVRKGKFITRTNMTRLTPHQLVRIALLYDIKADQWTTSRITILLRNTPAATPSPTPTVKK